MTSDDAGGPEGAPGGGETQKERLNRELDQLLEEVRVALPGVQVLLAFLLTVPFAQGFTKLDEDGRIAYLLSVVLAATASILLIAPTVHHRVRFRQGVKEQLILTTNVLVLAGATALGLAIGTATYLVGDTAFPATPARILGPGIAGMAAVVWFGIPAAYHRRRRET